MPPIDCHRAISEAARRAVLDIAHAANDVQEPWSWYAARRLSSPMRARAAWWLLTDNGAPVASLLGYPIRLKQGDDVRAAVGIGSVATLPEHRGRGHASRLIEHVLGEGSGDALLFSAIGTALYGKLGFVETPAWAWKHDRPLALVSDSDAAALRPIDPRREVGALESAWDALHTGVCLARDRDAWAATIADAPDDRWFMIEGGGYLRLRAHTDTLEILELCADAALHDRVVQAAAGLAAAMDLALYGWLEPTPWVEARMERASRAKTLPMVRGAWAADTARFAGSDHF